MTGEQSEERFFQELLKEPGPLRLLVEGARDFIAVVDREYRHRYLNRTLPGFTIADVIGTSVCDYTDPRYHAAMREAIDAVFETGEPQQLITQASGSPGETLWYRTVLSPLRDSGVTRAVSLIATEITDSRHVESELDRERRLLMASLDVSEAATVVLDLDHKVALVNHVGAELLGVDPADAQGRPWVESFVPEDHQDRAREELERLHSNGVDVSRNVNEVLDASGNRHLVAWHNVVIRDESGAMEAVVGFGEDITERGIPKEERLERESLLMSIFDATPIGIGFVQDRVFTRVNDQFCNLIGYEPEELIGRKSRIMYESEEEYLRVGDVIYGQIERGERGSVLARIESKDGTHIDGLISAAPLTQEDPDAGITFTLLDMTDQLRMESELREAKSSLEAEVESRTEELMVVNEELRAANAAKNQFLAAMSHELRTPLNSVIGFAGIMLDGMAGEITDEQRKQLSMVRGAGDRLLALVNDILDLARIEEGRLTVQATEFTLEEVVNECTDMLRLGADNKGLELTLDVPTPESVLTTDHRSVEQILINLLSNAVKYTDEGGIVVGARLEGESAILSVRDSGVGIGAGEMPRIFEAFHRAGDPTQSRGGTGLGLAISSRLAERLGGRLEVESVPGQGSTFTLTIPRILPA